MNDDRHLLDMDGKPLSTAALLDLAANWLDTMQDAIDVLASGYVGATSGDEFVRAGTEVQDALRRAAKALRVMPNNDWAIFAYMKENP